MVESHRLFQTPPHELAAITAAASSLRHYPKREVELIKKSVQSASAAIPVWPSYNGVSQLVGTSTSGKVTVYVDPTLGAPALVNAQDLVLNGDAICAANDAIFGTVGTPVNVIIFALGGATNGQGGADHNACDYVNGQNIEVDFDDGSAIPTINGPRPSPLARTHALFEAELSECSMGNNLCGLSTGEALSRWCAYIVAGNVITDFATAPLWVPFNPDWIDSIQPSDRDTKATGCGTAFLSWLLSKNRGGLGIPINLIAPKMVALGDTGTFAQLYAELTGKPATSAFPDFDAAITAQGGSFALTAESVGYGDDLFNFFSAPPTSGSSSPGPAPQPLPPLPPLPPLSPLPSA